MLLDKIVIGQTVESAMYAFLNDSYFLPSSSATPIFYDKLDDAIFGTKRKDYTWSRLQLILSLSGKLLNYENLQNINVTENNIKLSSDFGNFKYSFNRCYIFNPAGINIENNIVKHVESKYIVYDDFEISQLGGKHTYLPEKIGPDALASKIYFYISNRVDGANYITDCVVESNLAKNQLNDVNYSDSLIRFAILRYLASIGIHGNFMSLYKNGNSKFRKPKVKHKKRIICEVDQNIYEDTEKVKIVNFSMKEILNEISPTGS